MKTLSPNKRPFLKKLILGGIVIVLVQTYVQAQDTLYTKELKKIEAKVIEITPDEIKYKKADNVNGPTYIEPKLNVTMIVYSNGVKEIIKSDPVSVNSKVNSNSNNYYTPKNVSARIEIAGNQYRYNGDVYSEKKIQRLLMDTRNSNIVGYVNKARQAQKIQYVGFAAIPLGIIGLLALENATTPSYSNGQYTSKTNYNLVSLGALCIAGSITCPIVSGVFKHKRKLYNTEAVYLFNEKL
jgi:hypothetical protein